MQGPRSLQSLQVGSWSRERIHDLAPVRYSDFNLQGAPRCNLRVAFPERFVKMVVAMAPLGRPYIIAGKAHGQREPSCLLRRHGHNFWRIRTTGDRPDFRRPVDDVPPAGGDETQLSDALVIQCGRFQWYSLFPNFDEHLGREFMDFCKLVSFVPQIRLSSEGRSDDAVPGFQQLV